MANMKMTDGMAKPKQKAFAMSHPGESKYKPDLSTAKDLQNSPATDAHFQRAAKRLFGGDKPSNPKFTQKTQSSAAAAQTAASLHVPKVTFQKVAELKNPGKVGAKTPRDRSKRPV